MFKAFDTNGRPCSTDWIVCFYCAVGRQIEVKTENDNDLFPFSRVWCFFLLLLSSFSLHRFFGPFKLYLVCMCVCCINVCGTVFLCSCASMVSFFFVCVVLLKELGTQKLKWVCCVLSKDQSWSMTFMSVRLWIAQFLFRFLLLWPSLMHYAVKCLSLLIVPPTTASECDHRTGFNKKINHIYIWGKKRVWLFLIIWCWAVIQEDPRIELVLYTYFYISKTEMHNLSRVWVYMKHISCIILHFFMLFSFSSCSSSSSQSSISYSPFSPSFPVLHVKV